MKCRLKYKLKENLYYHSLYFHSNIGEARFHFTNKEEARIFNTVKEAHKIIKKYRFKNIEIEKIYKGGD